MKVFEGLDAHQAIKWGSKFVVQLNYGEYKINGVHTKGPQQVVVDSIDAVRKVIGGGRKIVKFVNTNDDEISVEEYRGYQEKVGQYYDDDCDELVFNSLEDRIEWANLDALLNEYEAVFEDIPKEDTEVDINVIGAAVDTGSDFIESPYELGKISFGNTKGVFKVSVGAISNDEVVSMKHRYPDVSVEIPTHSNIEYVKVAGEYVFANKYSRKYDWVGNYNVVRLTETLEEAQNLESDVRTTVRTRMKLFLEPKTIDTTTAKDVVRDFEDIQSKLSAIEVKQKSFHGKRGLFGSIDKMIAKYSGL